MSLLSRCKGLARKIITPPHAVVLAYHSILEEPAPFPIWQHLTAEQLDGQLRWLSENCTCITLGELLAYADAGRWPRNAVAVTFDDGFANNLHVALPLLERYGVPATFFIASGFIGSGRMIWPEVLACVLASARSEFTFAGARFALGNARERADAYQRLARHVRRTPPRDEDKQLAAIAHAAEVDLTQARSLPLAKQFRMMSWEELKRLAASDLAQIGAHTINHHPLSALEEAQVVKEISQSKRVLEEAIGVVKYFAYPYGSNRDFRPEHPALLEKQGFEAAFTARAAGVLAGVERFALPRLGVGNGSSPAGLEYQVTGGLALTAGQRRWRRDSRR